MKACCVVDKRVFFISKKDSPIQWGWCATSGQVDKLVYEKANTTFIEDELMLNKLMNIDPKSFRKLVQTFLEANRHG